MDIKEENLWIEQA